MALNLKVIVAYLFVCTVSCYPSRPLNDRPSELAWQAWLLVDSQNNHGETDRRITPKSVFIAPNIGDNGSLPDCAEGYRSDPMGRCIKFVRVDEAAHLDFLLQRLNEIYATNPSEELDDDDTKPTSGPLQVNIPLGGDFLNEDDFKANPEIAIIVAPTNGEFDEIEKLDDDEKVIVNKRTKDKEEKLSQTTIISTTMFPMDSTFSAITNTETVDTEMTTTTLSPPVSNIHAIFFLNPNDSHHAQTNHTAVILKKTDNLTEPPTTAAESRTTILQQQETSQTQTESISTSAFNFPTTYEQKKFFDLLQMSTERNYMTTKNSNSKVFPSNPEAVFRTATDKNYAHVRLASSEIVDLFKDYINQNPEIVSLSSIDREVVQKSPVSESTYMEDQITPQPQIQRPQYVYPPFNHRNRDRNSDFWRPHREETLPKPLVVRFGRHQLHSAPEPNTRFINSEQLFSNSKSFSDEFGRKRRRGNIR